MFAAPVVVASATCTAVQSTCCVCSAACCFGKTISASGQKAGRVASVWVLILGIVVSLVGRAHNWSTKLSLPGIYLPWTIASVKDEDCADGLDFPCSEAEFVLRVGAATAAFFLLQAVLCRLSTTFMNSFWAIKLLIFVALLGILQNVPIETLNNFVLLTLFKVAGIAYLMFQVLIFIEWTEAFNCALVGLDDTLVLHGGRRQEWTLWKKVLLALDILFGASSFAGCVLIAYSFHSCSTRSVWLASGCLMSIIGFTAVQLSDASEDQKKGNLFTSTFVACYAVHLCFAATVADPLSSPDVCPSAPPLVSSGDVPGHGISVYLSILFSVASAIMAIELQAFGPEDIRSNFESNDSVGQQKSLSGRNLENILTGTPIDDYGAVNIESIEDFRTKDTISAPSSATRDAAFSVLMVLASCYWTMLFCGWGTSREFVLWLNASVSWFAACLYLWTLLAPRLFPDRDFS